MSYAVGTLSPEASTGNESYTGVGFTPDFIIFTASLSVNATNSNAGGGTMCGIAVSSSSRAVVGGSGTSGAGTSDEWGWSDSALPIKWQQTKATTRFAADLVTMDADGFTLNWTTAGAGGYETVDITYQCFGGFDNVSLDQFTSPTSAGTNTTITTGFEADLLFIIGGFTVGTGAQTRDSQSVSVGAGTSTSSQWCINGLAEDGQGTSDTDTILRVDQICNNGYNTADFIKGHIHAITSTTYVIDWDAVWSGGSVYFWGLSVEGGTWDVGLDTVQTSAATKAHSTSNSPDAVFIGSTAVTSTNTYTADCQVGYGGDDATNSYSNSIVNQNAVGTTDFYRTGRVDSAAQITDNAGNDDFEGNVDSFNASDFTIDYTTADGAANYIAFMALENPATATTRRYGLSLLGVG